MTIAERVRQLLLRDPFLPFVLRQNSGKRLRVSLPDQLWFPPGQRRMEYFAERDRDVESAGRQVDLASIVEVIDESQMKEIGAPMTVEKFDEFAKRTPFEPFTVHVADGSRIAVIGPEFVARTQGGRTIFVSTGGERTEWIDLLLVTRLSTGVDNPMSREAGAA